MPALGLAFIMVKLKKTSLFACAYERGEYLPAVLIMFKHHLRMPLDRPGFLNDSTSPSSALAMISNPGVRFLMP